MWPGAVHDSRIFKESALRRTLEVGMYIQPYVIYNVNIQRVIDTYVESTILNRIQVLRE